MLVKEIKPAGQIVHEMIADAERMIAQRLASLMSPGSARDPGPVSVQECD
jgi:hypothetical protein